MAARRVDEPSLGLRSERSSGSDGPTTEWFTARPAGPLAGVIDSYVGYRLRGFPPGIHWGLPSRHATFIVSIGDPIDVVVQPNSAQQPEAYGTVLSGLQSASARIAHHGDQEGVAIELTPLGFRRLFGLPARELVNLSVEFTDVVGAIGRELRERMHLLDGWPARFAACDDVLTRTFTDGDPAAPELRRAWAMITASHGAVPVADVAAEVGWSRQHLRQRFVDELGMSPKAVGRIARFDRAAGLLRADPTAPIARVAADAGYYDQSHLDRDFRDLAGAPPSRWLAEDLPSVQDDEVLAAGSSSP